MDLDLQTPQVEPTSTQPGAVWTYDGTCLVCDTSPGKVRIKVRTWLHNPIGPCSFVLGRLRQMKRGEPSQINLQSAYGPYMHGQVKHNMLKLDFYKFGLFVSLAVDSQAAQDLLADLICGVEANYRHYKGMF